MKPGKYRQGRRCHPGFFGAGACVRACHSHSLFGVGDSSEACDWLKFLHGEFISFSQTRDSHNPHVVAAAFYLLHVFRELNFKTQKCRIALPFSLRSVPLASVPTSLVSHLARIL
jgi:hypothetical protein